MKAASGRKSLFTPHCSPPVAQWQRVNTGVRSLHFAGRFRSSSPKIAFSRSNAHVQVEPIVNRRVIVLLLAFCTQWASVTSSQDVSDATRHREANPLVRQLGDDRFAVRERATSLLIAMGIRASEALQSGIGSIDQEVRYRSSAVLAIIRDLDLQQRLDVHDAEREGGVRANSDLPREQRDHALFVAYAPHDAPRSFLAESRAHG